MIYARTAHYLALKKGYVIQVEAYFSSLFVLLKIKNWSVFFSQKNIPILCKKKKKISQEIQIFDHNFHMSCGS